MDTPPTTFADVVFPTVIPDRLTYRVPAALHAQALPGKRVLVPLGKRITTGYLVAVKATSPLARTKALAEVVDAEPLLDPQLLALTKWIADYYLCPWGEVIRTTLPPGIDSLTRRVVRVTDAGRAALESPTTLSDADRALLALLATRKVAGVSALGRRSPQAKARLPHLLQCGFLAAETQTTPPRVRVHTVSYYALAPGILPDALRATSRAKKQRAILEALVLLGPEGGPQPAVAGGSPAALAALVRKGLVTARTVEISRDPFAAANTAPDTPRTLNDAQAQALAAIESALVAQTFQPFLLYGITGSGKTEVYLQAIDTALRQGRQAIILVPEISLTPLVVQRFLARFGSRVAVLHSGLSPGERFDAWRRIRAGGADIVVGARSAVFAPLPRLGILVVDEEHDTSYKQDGRPRYHGRDVAVMRAKLLNIPIVLGSATPSFESFERATAGRYQLLVLPQRVEARPLPTVQVVDLRHCSPPERLLSQPLAAAIEHRLQSGEQALLFLNRRGFYTILLCEDCGTTYECPYCSIALTYHAKQERLRCHICGFARNPPGACRQCRGTHLRYFGIGTQQVEDAVRQRFPHARVARLDRDTAEGWRGLDAILRRLTEGAIDILVGTQMIGKGHDVPNVTLVGVISADAALTLPDFHAGERAFSLLTQVVGRAGRGDKPGLALIQTFKPDHAILRAVQTQDYTALWQTESPLRQQQALPPFTRAVLAVLSSPDAAATEAAAEEFVRCLDTAGITPSSIKGPVPAALYKVRTRYRWQVLIHEADTRRLHEHLRMATQRFAHTPLARTVQIDLDVDPTTIA